MDLPPTDNSDLIMKAFDYAREHNLDTHNKENVKQILQALDPEHASEKEVDAFMYQLNNAGIFMNIMDAKMTKNDQK